MKLKPMPMNLNVLWTRWSEYQIKKVKTSGRSIEYIMPTARASAITYNCAEEAENLTADALELGRHIYQDDPNVKQLCLEFVSRYGLLGTQVETLPPGPMDLPCWQMPDSKEYGEALATFQYNLMELYRHFISVYEKEISPLDFHVEELSGMITYRLLGGPAPQFIWEVRNMEAVIRFAYASMITTEPMPLKICKNCGRVYYNSHAKSEFCGTRCLNYYNVKAFREKTR